MTQAMIKRTARTLAGLALLILAGLLLVASLVALQGANDESRRVDAIALVWTTPPAPEHLNYTVDLYRRGYAARLLLVGEDPAAVQAALVAQGLPVDVVVLAEGPGDRWDQFQHAAAVAQQQGIGSILLVDTPGTLLRSLKMARDLGLRAYSAPVPATPLDAGVVLREAAAYWRYVLFGR